MTTPRRIWMHGQSNMVDANTAPVFLDPIQNNFVPLLQAYIDPAQAEAIVSRFYSGIPPNATAIGGIGMCFENLAHTLNGDYWDGPGLNHFVRPAAPRSTQWDNFAAWPFTTNGANIQAYATGLPAGTKAEIGAILAFHTEYETRGIGLNTSWGGDDPRVTERAWRRYMGALRANLGKTAADCPLLILCASAYGFGMDAGYRAVGEALLALVRDPSMNAHFVMEQGMDVVWDADGPTNAYTAHGNASDLALYCRRMARGCARILGPLWAPNSFGRLRAGNGPRLVWAQQLDASTIDVWVAHDGGSDFTLPADPIAGWRVEWQNIIATPSAVVRQDRKRIRLTLPAPWAGAAALRVSYLVGNTRLLPGDGIYDNVATYDAKALPPAVAGADRIAGTMRRTHVPLQVAATAPPFTV